MPGSERRQGLMDPRTPTPDPRLRVNGAIAATAAAAAAYVLALTVDLLPPHSIAVAMFVMTPVFATQGLVLLWHRRHESLVPDLSWFATGLAVSIVAMVLQLISFPAVMAEGGPLGTTQDSNTTLYLVFHLAPALGLLLGAWGAPARARAWFFGAGVLLSLAIALDLVPLPTFIEGGRFTRPLLSLEWVLVVVIAAGTIAWLARAGASARPLVAWVGISQSLAVYDVVLNALGAVRFTPVWWASLSMRLATYAVLAFGLLVSSLRHLRRMELYAAEELDRREDQLERSIADVRQLLDEATAASTTLQEQLLPRAMPTPEHLELAARYAGAGKNKEIGGDWYDAIVLPDGGLALIIGDVEGHDLAAAAVMGQVRAAVHSYALEGHPPSIVFERVDRFLAGSGIDRFVALAYVQLYPGDRLMTIAVAGNPVPLVVPHDGAPPTWVPVAGGAPLGLGLGQAWQERTLELPVDADLVLLTDGVFARSPWQDGDGEPLPDRMSLGTGSPGPASVGDFADALIGAVTDDDAAVLVARLAVDPRTAAVRTLPVHPISAPIARLWLADLMDVWVSAGELADSPEVRDRIDTAILLLTELVSNALRHGEETIRVRAELSGTVLRVDVLDTSHRMPLIQKLGETATSGRGLLLVEGLCDEWGVQVEDQGKSVWFSLDLEGSAPSEEELLAAFDLDLDGL